jgi:hypothetical protein
MIFNYPIIQIIFEKNVKDKVAKDNYTHFASYESLPKETIVILKSEKITEEESKNVIKHVKKHYKKYGEIKSCFYFKDGGEIIQLASLN